MVSYPVSFFMWLLLQIVKTGRWSLISFTNSPLTVLLSISLVNMLSIKVAQWHVILLGLMIFGYKLMLYIDCIDKCISHVVLIWIE